MEQVGEITYSSTFDGKNHILVLTRGRKDTSRLGKMSTHAGVFVFMQLTRSVNSQSYGAIAAIDEKIAGRYGRKTVSD